MLHIQLWEMEAFQMKRSIESIDQKQPLENNLTLKLVFMANLVYIALKNDFQNWNLVYQIPYTLT